MKNIFVTLFLIAAVSLVTGQGINGGFKIGMAVANMHGDDVEDFGQEAKTGLCAGGFIGFGLGNIVTVQPEILYTQKGIKAVDDGGWARFKIDYLEMPVVLKFTMPIQGTIKPYVMTGPYFAYNISAKLAIGDDQNRIERDMSDAVKDIDFGTVFGGGIDFELPVGKIVFDFRYGLGMITIDEPNGEQADVKNDAFSLTLGYAF